MRQRFLLPAAIAGAGLAGGLAGAGAVQAFDDDPQPVAATATDTSTPAAATTSSLAELYRRAAPSVVEISVVQAPEDAFGPFGPSTERTALGSGFVIDDKHVVTNQHVVDQAEQVSVRFANGDELDARVVGADPSTDVALLELRGDRELTPLQLGSSTSLHIGDPVAAIGSPFGLQGSLSSGVVSGLERDIRAPDGFTIDGAIQTDAALNHGNSGGPLLDAQGRVVGVASQIESENGGNVGVGYAIPIETAKRVVDELLSSGEVRHAYLGVALSDQAAADGGVPLSEVATGGPADDAGLRAGDVVLAIGGTEVDSDDDVRAAIEARDPGDSVEVRVRRDGDERTFRVELGERPAQVQ